MNFEHWGLAHNRMPVATGFTFGKPCCMLDVVTATAMVQLTVHSGHARSALIRHALGQLTGPVGHSASCVYHFLFSSSMTPT